MGIQHLGGEERGFRASELDLSPEQAKELESIQQTYFRETQMLRAQIFSKRIELRNHIKNPNATIRSIRSKYLEINEIESRFEEKALEYLIKVRTLLTPDQLRNWNPEEELPLLRLRIRGSEPMGHIHPRRRFNP